MRAVAARIGTAAVVSSAVLFVCALVVVMQTRKSSDTAVQMIVPDLSHTHHALHRSTSLSAPLQSRMELNVTPGAAPPRQAPVLRGHGPRDRTTPQTARLLHPRTELGPAHTTTGGAPSWQFAVAAPLGMLAALAAVVMLPSKHPMNDSPTAPMPREGKVGLSRRHAIIGAGATSIAVAASPAAAAAPANCLLESDPAYDEATATLLRRVTDVLVGHCEESESSDSDDSESSSEDVAALHHDIDAWLAKCREGQALPDSYATGAGANGAADAL